MPTAADSTTFVTALRDLVYVRTGLKIEDTRLPDVMRVFEKMRTGSPNQLLGSLTEQPTTSALWSALVNVITIGETYFFRDAAQFRALETRILPELIARRRASGFKHLSIWSAGCATGEEPYSLAILLRELIPDLPEWTFIILGTDINQTSLESARSGIFKPRSFREETRPGIQERWFQQHGSSFEIDPAVRKMVMFTPLNLVTDAYPSFETHTMNLDLIICRNVTIYFDEAVTRQIVQRFYQCLNHEGWLVVGHAEPMVSTYRDFTPRNLDNAVLYQKVPRPSAPEAPILNVRRKSRTAEAPTEKTVPPLPVLPKVDALEEAQRAANREDWNALERWLKTAERESAMNPHTHYLRALMFIHLDETALAIDSLRRAIYCDPAFPLAHYALGEVFEKRGNLKEARRCWQMARQTVTGLDGQATLTRDSGLTVEMFRGLVEYRLNHRTEK